MTIEPSGNSTGSSPVSRRTVVRGAAGAAAVAWTASAVTLVTATPAFAASADLKLAITTAQYVGNVTPFTSVNPTQLSVVGTYGNQGPQATKNFQITLKIPANLYATAPTAAAVSGFTASAFTGSLAAGWTIVFTRTAQLASGVVNQPFSTTITFTDPGASFSDAPFRRWAGTSFALTGTATATNGTPAAAAPTVAATPNVNFSVTDANAIWADASGNNNVLFGPNLRFTAAKVYNAGNSSIGKMKLEIRINRPGNVWPGTNFFRGAPKQVAVVQNGSRWQQLSGSAGYNFNGGAGPWCFYFETIENGFTPATANGGSDALDGPVSPEGIDILIKSNGGDTIVGTFNAPHSVMTVSADHANPSAHNDNAWTS
ncbi:MAG TPA: hypothetical protein PLQ19_07555 [Aeromicrobium sp.]|nr:hypothetical protein [Aeromicrobium sp.]